MRPATIKTRIVVYLLADVIDYFSIKADHHDRTAVPRGPVEMEPEPSATEKAYHEGQRDAFGNAAKRVIELRDLIK